MRICVILEGCYPYVTGGVSTWIHQYMQAMPQHEFVVWAVGASSEDRGKFKYNLPENVVEVREIFLNDALTMGFSKQKYKFNEKEMQELREFINCRRPNWEVLFHMYHDQKISPLAFLTSEEFLEILMKICHEEYPYTAFSDLFHTVRSMLLPVLYIMQEDVPKADIYHSIATGYSGILARLGSYLYKVPYMITEHGIYTREREEEIIRAKWVVPAFKRFWVRFFYMLSAGAYDGATMVTSLFERAMETQIEMGCAREKCRFIGNGVHFNRFVDIPPKKENGYVDIGAVLRIAPIKDVKTMIYAFAELKTRVPNARLYIAGPEDDEEYAKECYALAEQLKVNDLIFTGTVNVLEYMQNFDFTILTSISEGQPLAVLESFAAGRPCVTTDVGCCKELIAGMTGDDLGIAGYCVPPMHRTAICDAMELMCTRPEERYQMGIVAKKRVERYFRHEYMIKNYLDAYDEVFRRWQA
ncbi:GT4 family glycosyltransferase PelF [Ruminococcus sp. 5_1_39BFAA]|uniref:GT4 family glycosyltransferase PelF n=1 Tax=Ruminococcus sp. 5_1_39BFAA TaxID=457412 RepID=UPI00356B3EBB